MAVAIGPVWPAHSQERPKETVKPVVRPAATTTVKPATAQGGPTTRSPQTGAAGADESARPAEPKTVRGLATQGGPEKRSSQTADADAVTLNFLNADIEGVVKAMSEITGRNFVLDSRVKGTINIISSKPMPLPCVVIIICFSTPSIVPTTSVSVSFIFLMETFMAFNSSRNCFAI